jgi:predicted RNase H-like HicB family nuclease
MARKASVVIEKDQHGFYAWCPELKGCQSQGDTCQKPSPISLKALAADVAQSPSKVKGQAAGKSFVFSKIFARPETGKETLLPAAPTLLSARSGFCRQRRSRTGPSPALEEAMANIKEAVELHLETLPAEERDGLLSREILTTAVKVDA